MAIGLDVDTPPEPENPGRIGELSRTIARIKTIQREEGDLEDEA